MATTYTNPQNLILKNLIRVGIGLLAVMIALLVFAGAVRADEPVTAAATDTTWRAVYYNNTSLSGQPAFNRDEATIDHNWGYGSPHPSVNSDHFSARWTRVFEVAAGTYRFSVTGDDGVRVFLNDELILNGWWDHGVRTFTVDRPLAAGNHVVRVEFYERTGTATVRFSLDPISGGGVQPPPAAPTPTPAPPPAPEFPAQPVPAEDTWRGEYFNNDRLEGSPALVRQDSAINFNWGDGSPAAGLIGSDHFSVRWTRNIYFEEGLWRFKTTTDDGVRLYIDGKLVIDRWQLLSGQSFEVKVGLEQGVHTIRVEYFEYTGGAIAKLAIENAVVLSDVGNLITCVPPNPPNYAWIRVYRKDANGNWYRAIPKGVGSIHPSGFLKIDGLPVDIARYGNAGEPYWIEQWIDGKVARSVGNTDRGEPEFRIRPNADNYTPWQCGR